MNDIREVVRDAYGKTARGEGEALGHPMTQGRSEEAGCCGPSCCGGPSTTADELARKIGYSPEELRALPEGSNLGLSCGNPTAIAALEPGQVVLDLGSGGGFDCFVAGPKVGAKGRVIGVDMTPDMIARARRNLASYRKSTGLENVEFRLGEIEHLPVADRSVDVVISNCVINLSPEKPQVWSEIARVLRPGGRVAASDIALLRPLPDAVKAMVEALVGCVAGAVLLDEYRAMVEAAGLVDARLTPKPEYVASLRGFEDPLFRKISEALPEGTAAPDFLTSVDVTARKRA
ncbi:MAG TPA: arsenite methyltransferase [Planctomycetota bacterium]|nr:arsenite methyltransferase [Planctomycetota bacterium]